ncbi:hypothetical protein FZ103_10560 [Streptomonospora sp. PA3]|uniref:hypothetical protein n=1 Tax=Streptomonospora sp. PA3 TaxID=2607326 RepID=UPI0012DE2135|nr:hypothetical protein [Streptomonospora sp. PA3]MUL41612.1 hypothetical protein [Streptomonospora sp. PA3]
MPTLPEGLIPSPAEYRAHTLAWQHLDEARRAFDRIDAFVLPRTVEPTPHLRASLRHTLNGVADWLQRACSEGDPTYRDAPVLAHLIGDKLNVAKPVPVVDAHRKWVFIAARRLVCLHAPTHPAVPGIETERWLEQHPHALQVMRTAAERAAKACP